MDESDNYTLYESYETAYADEDYETLKTVGMLGPCQPIGCDAGIHLPGCCFIETDDDDGEG